MSAILDFVDREGGARFSAVQLDSGEPVWISIARTGVLIKQSRIGLFGAVLFQDSIDARRIGKTIYIEFTGDARANNALARRCSDLADNLERQFKTYTIPSGIRHFLLRALTQTALNSKSSIELIDTITQAHSASIAQSRGLEDPYSFYYSEQKP